MPTPITAASLEFRHGIDTRNSPRLVDPSYLLRAHNRYFEADAGLVKRNGYGQLSKAISGGGTIAKGSSILTYKDELLLADGTSLYSYSDDAGWLNKGALAPTKVSLRSLAPGGANQYTCDYACTPDREVWVYQDDRDLTGIRVTIADRKTGAYILRDQLFMTGAGIVSHNVNTRISPRFAQTRTGWILLYAYQRSDLSADLYGREVLGMSGTPFGPENLIAHIQFPDAYDVAFDGTTTLIAYLGWVNNGVVGPVTVAPLHRSGRLATLADSVYMTSTGASFTPDGTGPFQLTARVNVAFDPTRPGYAMVTLQDQNFTAGGMFFRCKFINAQLGASWSWSDPDVQLWYPGFPTPGTNLQTTAFVDFTGVGYLFAAITGADWGSPINYGVNTSNITTVVFTTADWRPMATWWNHGLYSKPFMHGGDLYVWLRYAGGVAATATTPQGLTTQQTAFALNVSRGNLVARLAYGLTRGQSLAYIYGDGSRAGGLLPNVVARDTDEYVVAGLAQRSVLNVSATLFGLRFVSAYQLQSARLGDSLVLCSGVVSSYDGASITPHGFLLAPDVADIEATEAGSVTGNLQWCFVWEWLDAAGQLHRSAPSTPISMTLTSKLVKFFVNSLLFDPKLNVELVGYRTQNNGPIFYRLPGTQINLRNAWPTLYLIDNSADAAVAANAILYTVGGELENDPPPAAEVICASKNRLFIAGGDDPEVVTYTKTSAKGGGPAFSLAFQRRIMAVPGPITGIAAMDDKIVVFKNPGIFWWSGEGPSVSGVNDDFTTTQLLTKEFGCLNASSLVTTQDGIYFQSSKGVWLLTRSLELVQVGAPVQAYNAQTIVSAVMQPDLPIVRFGCLEDTALIYHYRMLATFSGAAAAIGQWTTFGTHAQVGAVVWRGAYTFARADGSVWVQNTGYRDPTGPVGTEVVTAWLKASGLLQTGKFSRLALMGGYGGPHRLRIDLAYDYRTVPFASMLYDTRQAIDTTAWGSDPAFGGLQIWGGDSDDTYVMQGPLPVQQTAAAAIQLSIFDEGIPGQPLGNSASLEAISLLAQPEAELIRVGPKKTIG